VKALDLAALREEEPRVVRRVAIDLLASVREKHEKFVGDDDPEGLHDFRVAVRRLRSWIRAFRAALDDSLGGTHRHALKRIAGATRDSRDLDVHIQWVQRFSRRRPKAATKGIHWLLDQLRARKATADRRLAKALDRNFDRAVAGIDDAADHFTASVLDGASSFGHSAAGLIRAQATDTRTALQRVANKGDRTEAHEARIAAKRLRYLLEPLSEAVDGVATIVDRLSSLQDDFGALHDAQVFGDEIAHLLAKARAGKHRERLAGLRAVNRKLRQDETAAFTRVRRRWLGQKTAKLWTGVEKIAAALDAAGSGAP